MIGIHNLVLYGPSSPIAVLNGALKRPNLDFYATDVESMIALDLSASTSNSRLILVY
jgi:hypothetical protein